LLSIFDRVLLVKLAFDSDFLCRGEKDIFQ
jgi:hypothetical protein